MGQGSPGRVGVVVAEPVVRQGVGVGAGGHLAPLQALGEVALDPQIVRDPLFLSCMAAHHSTKRMKKRYMSLGNYSGRLWMSMAA